MTLIPDAHDFKTTQVLTNDGIKLCVRHLGHGRPVVFIHGFAQTSLCFARQIKDFGQDHHAIAVDLRGHGDSEKVDHGYRVGRLAADLNDVFSALCLSDITLVSHSMGCGVAWAYLEQYGYGRIRDLVFIDRPACLVTDPTVATHQAAPFSPDEAFKFAAELRGDSGYKTMEALVQRMVSSAMPAAEKAWFLQESLKISMQHAASLFISTRFDNWADILKTIPCPTLIVAAENSMMSSAKMQEIASQVKGATFNLFTGTQASHFMFWEMAGEFNQKVRSFLKSQALQ